MKYDYNLTVSNPAAYAKITGPGKLSRLSIFLAWLYIQAHLFVVALAITIIVWVWQ